MVHKVPIKEEEYYEYYTPEAEHIEVSYPKVIGYEDTTNVEINNLNEKIKLFNNKLLLIKKIYKKIPCGGWGELISKEKFLKRFQNENNPNKA